MKRNLRFVSVGTIACLLPLTLALSAWKSHSLPLHFARDKETTTSARRATGTPVLLELFTSEGCSSCPSADRVLAELKRTQPLSGVQVIALSEHVDYWNGIGWTDPYSSSQFTTRQSAYSSAFHLDQVYTPQAVIDGQAEMVGSEREKMAAAIRHAAQRPKATVEIAIPAGAAPNELKIDISRLPAVRAGDTANVMLAITQDNLSNTVTRGENAGHTLAHAAVVRSLHKIGTVSDRTAFTTTAMLDLKPGWKRSDLEAIVFVQEHNSGRVLGVNVLRLADK